MGLVNAWISPRVKLKEVLFLTGCWFHFLTFHLNNYYDIAFNSRQKKMCINPFSSNIHIQILQTELLTFP